MFSDGAVPILCYHDCMSRREIILAVVSVAVFGMLIWGYQWAKHSWYPEYMRRQKKLHSVRKQFHQRTVNNVLTSLHKQAWKQLEPNLARCGFRDWPRELSLVVIKADRKVEMWARDKDTEPWSHVRDYKMTAFSGTLGPKLREGDGQIPEGIYKVAFLNANSRYHLSLMLDYPNAFDREMGQRDGRKNLGNNIFIHGDEVTIGCIPIGDSAIEEVFVAVGMCDDENISVVITPVDFRKGLAAPDVGAIDWENRLYSVLKQKLQEYPLKPHSD